MKKKVIIAEFYSSHSEILYTVVEFFRKSDYEVHLWLNDVQIYNTDRTPNVILNYRRTNSHFSRISFILGLIRYVRKNQISKVFVNTADGLQVRNFCMVSMLFKYEVSGVLHISARLLNSVTQKIISAKIKKYFVLSHYILKNVESIPGITFGVFYPLVIDYSMKNPKKSNPDFIISIPGEISPYRKSYFGLIEILKNNRDEIPNGLKFELLGTVRIEEGRAVTDKIKEYGLSEYFIIYDEFIPNEKFYERCELADFVMPLVNPDVDNFENYLKYQIAGAFNIAYIFQKPLLMNKCFERIEDFTGISVYYTDDNLIEVLRSIMENRNISADCRDNYKKLKKFDFERQRSEFMELIQL